MAHLSLEALRRVSLALLRERAAAERALQAMDAESDDAHDLADEVVQMMKVEGELYDAYTELHDLQSESGVAYPTWEELAAAAAEG